MKDKRIHCPKCGRPLVFGCGYAAVGVECSCGHIARLHRGRILGEDDGREEDGQVHPGRQSRTQNRKPKKERKEKTC